MTELPPLTVARWLAALAPIATLLVLVLHGRLKTPRVAAVAAGAAIVIALGVFGADWNLVAVGGGKGLWTGIWILYVIWPALLLFQLANRAGLTGIGGALAGILPTRTENLLIVAWVLPSFVQGVAGFGTPIAVAAPLLVAMGVSRRHAVALPLIGYHWSVTFGSMGSSFYMGALTAGLVQPELGSYSAKAAVTLGLNALLAGALVCLMIGGWRALREGAVMLATTGTVMAATLVLAAQAEPSIASVSAGAAGLATVPVLRLVRSRRGAPSLVDVVTAPPLPEGGVRGTGVESPQSPGQWRWLRVLTPYAILLALVLPVFLSPGPRDFVKSNFLVGPSFGATETSYGLFNRAVPLHSPIALLGHPGTYLLVAALVGAIVYLRLGLVSRADITPTIRSWLKQARSSSPSVLLLAGLAGVMVEAGMIRLLAEGTVLVTGGLFPLLSPMLGALGSFATGSTTTSNALLAALQGRVATLIGIAPSTLIAAQTAGGNVGNSLAPVVILVGAGSVGASEEIGAILRTVARPAAALLVFITLATAMLVW
jgi:lactate permease